MSAHVENWATTYFAFSVIEKTLFLPEPQERKY